MTLDSMPIEEALASDGFSHARCRRWCGAMIVYVYHRDPESPSGVWLAASAVESPEIDGLFRKYNRPSPLSPTEPR